MFKQCLPDFYQIKYDLKIILAIAVGDYVHTPDYNILSQFFLSSEHCGTLFKHRALKRANSFGKWDKQGRHVIRKYFFIYILQIFINVHSGLYYMTSANTILLCPLRQFVNILHLIVSKIDNVRTGCTCNHSDLR